MQGSFPDRLPFMLMLAIGFGFTFAPSMPPPAALTGTIWFVDDDAPGDPGPGDTALGDPGENGSLAHPFDTIQEGLDLAAPDDMVKVLPGAYHENLALPAGGCTLAGGGRDVTKVTAAGGPVLAGLLVHDPAGPVPALSVRGLSLEGSIRLGATSIAFPRVNVGVVLEKLRIRTTLAELLFDADVSMAFTDIEVDAGDFDIASGNSAHVRATARHLRAPHSLLRISAGTEGSFTFDIADSEVSGLAAPGYKFASGTSIAASHVRFTGSGLDAASMGGCEQMIKVEHSRFEQGGARIGDLSTGDGLCGRSVSHITISHSRFMGQGIDYTAGFGTEQDARPGELAAVFDANRLEGSGLVVRSNHGLEAAGGAASVRVVNNVFDGGGQGIRFEFQFEDAGTSVEPLRFHADIMNNTLVDQETGIRLETAAHLAGQDAIGTSIINNLVVGGGSGLVVHGLDDHGDIIFSNDLYAQSGARYDGDLPDLTGTDGNLSADPLFADSAAGDYRLTASSPCVDAGVGGPGLPTTDFAGHPRLQDGDGDGIVKPDIGAFELQPLDVDGDGYPADLDCDDTNASIHPGAAEVPGNGIDENCDDTLACDPAAVWKTHGQFVQCVARTCNALVKRHLMERGSCRVLVADAVHSSIGKPSHRTPR